MMATTATAYKVALTLRRSVCRGGQRRRGKGGPYLRVQLRLSKAVVSMLIPVPSIAARVRAASLTPGTTATHAITRRSAVVRTTAVGLVALRRWDSVMAMPASAASTA